MVVSPRRIEETKNMWPHMNRARISPVTLCNKSSLAGQRLFPLASVNPVWIKTVSQDNFDSQHK
jgi:hypothetical protein